MSTGDAADMIGRLGLTLPPWFACAPPNLQAILSGLAAVHVDLYDTIGYAQLQSRLATITDGWVDAASGDFFPNFPRRLNEPDAAFSLRIRREVLRPRNTRIAIQRVLQDLTGNTPTVFRPSYVADTGGVGTGAMGVGVAGRVGSYSMPFQSLVDIKRGTAPGSNPGTIYAGPVAGIGSPIGGVGQGALMVSSGAAAQGGVTDADIYAAVASVTPAGHINWVRISD